MKRLGRGQQVAILAKVGGMSLAVLVYLTAAEACHLGAGNSGYSCSGPGVRQVMPGMPDRREYGRRAARGSWAVFCTLSCVIDRTINLVWA
jgi:hypothetical protein